MSFGYVIDTSVLIRYERSRIGTTDMLKLLRASLGEVPFAISTMTVMEFTHGIARAESPAQRERRITFADDLYASVDVKDVTHDIAKAAGLLRGAMSRNGSVLASEDLLIGVTALHLGYAVLTHNTRHFEMIPRLEVVAPSFTL